MSGADNTSCPRCGTARSHSTPAGLICPACLIANASATAVAAPPILCCVRILNIIGEGPRGRVYLAELLAPAAALVSVKRLHAGASAIDDEQRRRLLAFDHPNVAAVLDCGVDDTGTAYVVSEYVPGVPLPEFCRQPDQPLSQKLSLLLQLTAALEYAAAHGLRHTALKPANVLVDRSSGTVKVLDFDTARGPDALAAPNDRSELAPLAALVVSVLEEAAPRGTQCPPDLADIIRRAASTTAEGRYERLRDLSADLTVSLTVHGG